MKRLLLPLSFIVIASCGGSGGTSTPAAPTAPSTFTVGGTLSGLGAGKSVTVQINGAGNLTVSANGSFTFVSPIATGGGYSVTVLTQPLGQTCSITNGSGTVASANVTSVGVACVIAIAAEWTGTASSTSSSINGSAQLVWTFDRIADNVAYYKPTGTASVVATGCTVAPSSGTINPLTDGLLVVDYNVTPPTYRGSGATTWMGTRTCPPLPPFTSPITAAFMGGPGGTNFVEATGQVGDDGTTIKGTATGTGGVVTFTWSFTRRGTR